MVLSNNCNFWQTDNKIDTDNKNCGFQKKIKEKRNDTQLILTNEESTIKLGQIPQNLNILNRANKKIFGNKINNKSYPKKNYIQN